jgi:hypothetical protein
MGRDDITEKIREAVKDVRPDAKSYVPTRWLVGVCVLAIVGVAAVAIVAIVWRG